MVLCWWGTESVGGGLESHCHLGVYNNIFVEKDLSESTLALNAVQPPRGSTEATGK